ncbi:MAG: YihY/virulence factor BrkB family protein [Propionibacteriaceae bacterium]
MPDPSHEPNPEGGTLPAFPRELERVSWRFVLRRTWRKFWVHECTDLAAGLTYYGIIGVFPGLIVLVSVLGLVGKGQASVTTLTGILERAAPQAIIEFATPILDSLVGSRNGWGLVLGIAGALYTVSRYVRAFGRALNRVYGVREGRPIWALEARMLLVTVVVGVLTILTVAMLVVSGPVADLVGQVAGVGPTVVFVWDIVKWPVVVIIAVIIVAVLYYVTPNVRQPHWRWVSVGALLALIIWGIASAAFGAYVANFSRYDAIYGSLAGVIVFLVWLWVTNLAVLVGAIVDCELERVRELEAGHPSETTLQLPLRDTRLIAKQDRGEELDLARARSIRTDVGRLDP